MKEREIGLDLIRIILIWMIFNFHFCEANVLYSSRFFTMANGTWGWVATSSFIVLSGFLLARRYEKLESSWKFYKKRFLTIYPSFYIAFLVGFIIHGISLGSPFYGGHPAKILLTILGFDSYAGLYGVSTYAVVGEWFTGMIVILYLLYPALNLLMNRCRITASIVFFLLYVLNVIIGLDPTTADASVITGIFIFWCGMLIGQYSEWIKKCKILGLVSWIVFLFFSFIKIGLVTIFACNFMGILLFLGLLILCQGLKGDNKVGKLLAFLSGISYEVYLIHHFIMYKFAAVTTEPIRRNPLYYIATLVVTVLGAICIHCAADGVRRLLKGR